MSSSTGSNEPLNMNEPLPVLGSSPLFPIYISSDEEEVNPRIGRGAISPVPFPNLEVVWNEGAQSPNGVLNEEFELDAGYEGDSDDEDDWMAYDPPNAVIIISFDESGEDSEDGGSVVDDD